MSENTRSSIVKREAPSQRRHYRLTAPTTVSINKVEHPTLNWSIGGFSIPSYEGAPTEGEEVEVGFFLDFQGFRIAFTSRAEILRRNEDQIGARFIGLGQREEALIRYFASSVIGGDMVEVDGALARLDRPVTPAAGIARPHTEGEKRKHGILRKVVALGYIAAGLVLAGFLGVILAHYLLRLDVQTAVVRTGIEQVVSHDVGHVAEVYVQPDARVTAGQPLFRVQDDQVTQWLTKATEDAGTAQVRLHDAQQKLALGEKKFKVYQTIGTNQVASAKAAVETATADLTAAKIDTDRIKALLDNGIIAARVYDQQKAILANKQGALDHAIADYNTIKNSTKATDNGLMFSANYLVGDVATLQAEVKAANEQVKVAEASLQQAIERGRQLIYRAPYDGTVVRLYKSPGMTVNQGEEIVILRHDNGEPTVDAYLTQDEIVHVQAGTEGVAWVPGTSERYKVKVVEVDRTSGFIKELETPRPLQPTYNWRGVEDKSAYAKLVFVSLSEKDREKLMGGMPVYVNLPKDTYIPFLSWLRNLHWFHSGTTQTGALTAPRSSLAADMARRYGKWFSDLLPSLEVSRVYAAGKKDAVGTTALWPSDSALLRDHSAQRLPAGFESVRGDVLNEAQKALRQDPNPVETLHSSGVSDKTDPAFLASRKAFEDSDKFALLALAYRLTGDSRYLSKAKQIVMAWVEINRPTGEPIDETRLDGFLWGIDLLRSDFSGDENHKIDGWLEQWLAAKRAFKMGSISATNNHKTHQLKIVVMLDKLLGRTDAYNFDLTDVKKQLDANVMPNGVSIDYQQRDAMHYHIYDLEAWAEIALVTGCCEERIDKAFAFYVDTLRNDPNHIEFAKSTAPIDSRRAQAGFDYAQAKAFDAHDAARATYSYATLPGRHVDASFWKVAEEGQSRKNLFYLARFYLWNAK